MSIFRKKEDVVEAVQWFREGDHPAVSARVTRNAIGLTACPVCSLELRTHGFLEDGGSSPMVCPGDWVVNEKGVLSLYSNTRFFKYFNEGRRKNDKGRYYRRNL